MNWHNDWAEQTASFKLDLNFDNHYIIDGESCIYTSLADVIVRTNPRIEYAVMDNADTITAFLSHEPSNDTKFKLYINSLEEENISVVIGQDTRQIILSNLPTNIKPNDLVEIRANSTFMPSQVSMRCYLNNFYYSNSDMGITFDLNYINLRLWAPTAKLVELLIYNDRCTDPVVYDYCYILENDLSSGTHFIKISRFEFEHKFYLYRLYFDALDKLGKKSTRITYAVDPYANGISLNGDQGALVDLNSPELTPINWHRDKRPPLINKQDSILYEMHLRDFTIVPESGVTKELRGKFRGAVETGCSYIDSQSGLKVATGIDSLVELGITHVHILPIFDFATVDKTRLDDINNRNWGYDPKNYNSPDGSYSLDPHNPSLRIKEAKEMVYGFHKNGIRVVMDMVYNHMADTTNMSNIVPNYYFRTDRFGKVTNGSGCGNELATEHPMVRKFIIDSILHWVKDYKIDGIRLDLMELMDIETMKKIVSTLNQVDPTLLIYGEPWKGGDSPLTNGTYRGSQRGQGFSIFNDIFRDAIRGSNYPGHGFINGAQHTSINAMLTMDGLMGSINNLTNQAVESVNYVDAHDNYTLWDHIEKSSNPDLQQGSYRKEITDDVMGSILVRKNLLAMGIVLTAQGIPFIHGGAEILRTKNGDHNSYRSNDEVNAFFWQDKVRFKPVFDYFQGLITLRKQHPAFRMSDRLMIEESLSIKSAHNDHKSGVIISHFKNNANGDSWGDIVIIYNATGLDGYDINSMLPMPVSGEWHIVVNHEKAGVETLHIFKPGGLLPLRAHSLLVIHS